MAKPVLLPCAPFDRPTSPLIPPLEGIKSNVAVNVPLCDGNAELVKAPLPLAVTQTAGGWMLRPTLVLWLVPPLVPVMGPVRLPVAAAAEVETVSVEVPEPVTDGGLKLALTPAGKLPVLKATVPPKPLIAPIVTA